MLSSLLTSSLRVVARDGPQASFRFSIFESPFEGAPPAAGLAAILQLLVPFRSLFRISGGKEPRCAERVQVQDLADKLRI